jgi:hypothetical protein
MEELIKAESTEVLAFAGYKDFEAAADRTANKIKEGFMEMGYILKMARDTDILQDSEYTDYQDFAKRRYQLDPGTVSRYIRIVQNFSVDGNSHVLKDQYKDFGFAKLAIMLSIPEAINEALSPNLSKTEIQAIKDEVDAESKVTDIEVEIEKAEAAAVTDKPMLPPEGSPLERNLWQLGKEQEELFRKLWEICFLHTAFGNKNNAEIMDVLIPQGDAVYTVLIPGERRTQIIVNSDGATIVNLKTLERSRYTEDQICDAVRSLIDGGSSPEEQYKKLYGEDLTPEEPEIAPVQPTDSPKEKKPEKRKESRVTKANTEPKKKPKEPEKKPEQMTIPGAAPDPAPKEPETQVTDSCSGESEQKQNTDTMDTEEQVPGQTDLESDFPQYCPDADQRTAYLQSIRGAVDNLVRYAEMDLIIAARVQVKDISEYLDKLEELIKEADSNAEAVEAGESAGV